jgi:hypothetical protein
MHRLISDIGYQISGNGFVANTSSCIYGAVEILRAAKDAALRMTDFGGCGGRKSGDG